MAVQSRNEKLMIAKGTRTCLGTMVLKQAPLSADVTEFSTRYGGKFLGRRQL